jgi:hypothetical protein
VERIARHEMAHAHRDRRNRRCEKEERGLGG